MARGKGRPNKYITNVKPRLNEIEQMALVMTEKQIAKVLGVGYSSFMEYKKQYPELLESLKNGRESLVYELRSTLIQKAKGFDYTEKSKTYENGKLTKEEIKVKHAQPDVAAINLLLKNYDTENWANDPHMLEIRRKELELRQQQVEANNW